MSERSLPDPYLSALERERDDAREELRFEQQRGELAMSRVEALRQDNAALREQLKALALAARTAPRPPEEPDLAERLKLAIDSNRRLERDLARQERELEELRGQLREERELAQRLNRRIRALEGSLRMAQGHGNTEA